MNQAQLDQLRTSLPTRALGIALAAEYLVRKLDRPGMTIELLRVTAEAELFRVRQADFRNWLLAAIAAVPPDVCPEEEKRFLTAWLLEKDRAVNAERRMQSAERKA